MTGLSGKDSQHRTARIRQLVQNRKETTARKGQAFKAARTGQPEWNRQSKTSSRQDR
jgi:hypothetical protein